jgi:nucleoside-diphosphate kinase
MIKPDGVRRKLTGRLLQRFEDRGFEMIAAKLVHVSKEQAEFHYAEHKEKPFFGELVSFITSGAVFATVWQGENVIAISRAMMGKTNPVEAAPGTIRGDYAVEVAHNVIHGSDSRESAEREIANFFKPVELAVQVPHLNDSAPGEAVMH